MSQNSGWKSAEFASALELLDGLSSQALAAGKTIPAVMHADLRTPGMTSSAYIVRDFGYMVFDTLVATDSNYKIQPQMAEWKVSAAKLNYNSPPRHGSTRLDPPP